MFDFLRKIISGDSESLTDALKQGGTVIDVRSPTEFASGSVSGAINIPHMEIHKQKKVLDKAQQPLILCCASGMRSALALKDVQSLGFSSAINAKTWRRVKAAKDAL